MSSTEVNTTELPEIVFPMNYEDVKEKFSQVDRRLSDLDTDLKFLQIRLELVSVQLQIMDTFWKQKAEIEHMKAQLLLNTPRRRWWSFGIKV